MYQIKKIIVCLDQSEMDKTLVQFAAFIAKSNQSKKIYFTNIIRNLSIPKDVLSEFPNLINNIVEERKTQMKQVVKENLDPDLKINTSFVVREGQLSKKILKLASEKSADLILVGKKTSISGSGVITQRLARRASCSLLIVPENSSPKVKRILVPSDFSDYSKDALEEAIEITEKNKGKSEIICQNVYSVPSGYHFTGKTYEEFSEIMLMNAEVNYKKFIRKIDAKGHKIKPLYTKDEDDDPVVDIINKAKEIDASLIIIGAKGRTAATALFIGSLAERLIQVNNTVPLLVTRPKGKNAGIIEYILEI
ncbi:universal stress protein [uncultured Cyclobacterium sp.]|uniref:universal stress protein n=1 Tax=uncultured Cyclobacterium sp. TaxID=453820 RepID=UPI0030ED2CE7|tara:strand:- start:21 stop:944 length:924 start_codon:yes stop_codon:yes gene_type:complete